MIVQDRAARREPEAGREHVPPAQRTIPALLERAAERCGERPFVRFGDRARSFAETAERAAAYAATLAGCGVGPGDRVAVMCRNSLEFVDLWFGCCWRGAIMVPVNASLRGPGLEHVLNDAEPRVLAIGGELLEHLARVSPPASLERIWTIGGSEDGLAWKGGDVEPLPPPASTPLAPHPVRPGDTAAILYTGGTTGPSKGVCSPHAQAYWWGVNTGRNLGVASDSVLYTVLPLFHTNALNTLSQGLVNLAVVVLGTRFSASRFWADVCEADATHTYVLGAMVSMLLKQAASPTDRAHRVWRALAPAAPREAIRPFEHRFGVQLVQGYGSTETNSVMCNLLGPYRLGAMGRVAPGFEARVVDETDAEVPPDFPGELTLRSDEPFAFFTGYWRRPERTVEAWRNLWFHTGDTVVRDGDGVFWFKDRLTDSIRRRGENISAYEVEQVLQSHADVLRAAVVPTPSDLGEDEVLAFVVLREGVAPDPVGLIRYCEPRLAYFAIPRYVEYVEDLPLTEVGRVKKFVLRERGRGDGTWDREASGYVLRRD